MKKKRHYTKKGGVKKGCLSCFTRKKKKFRIKERKNTYGKAIDYTSINPRDIWVSISEEEDNKKLRKLIKKICKEIKIPNCQSYLSELENISQVEDHYEYIKEMRQLKKSLFKEIKKSLSKSSK